MMPSAAWLDLVGTSRQLPLHSCSVLGWDQPQHVSRSRSSSSKATESATVLLTGLCTSGLRTCSPQTRNGAILGARL